MPHSCHVRISRICEVLSMVNSLKYIGEKSKTAANLDSKINPKINEEKADIIRLPVLLYGTETCNLNKSDIHSFDFAVMRLSMKLFRTNNANLVLEILSFFNFELPILSV
jgi:hypothetical protein